MSTNEEHHREVESDSLSNGSVDIRNHDLVITLPQEDSRSAGSVARIGRSDGERDGIHSLVELERFLQSLNEGKSQ